MRVEDLELDELLEVDPLGGYLRFANQRVLMLDAVAIGLLRRHLVDTSGLTEARRVLTQFGFAHGTRMAEAAHAELRWDAREDWHSAGMRMLELEGLFRASPGSEGPLSRAGQGVENSFEAEQHLLYFGRSTTPVCWTLCGLMAGYLSRSSGEEVYVFEDRCIGRGDPSCHLLARTRAEWEGARTDELAPFSPAEVAEGLGVPLRPVVDLLRTVERKIAVNHRAMVRVSREVEQPMGIVARSAAMRQLLDLARRVARVDSTVLITGESGSGKERIARLVHEESTRAAGPFIAVNCGAITETLLESELFGHARGAFTGATHDRPGLFEAANHGTLLLDEVGEVSTGMQVKLLRVLQEREIRRVGENKNRPIDVRVVAATNRDLAHGVAGGAFRQDLYYRLKVVELRVPALRDRREDILPLARALLADAATWMKRKIGGLAPDAVDQLLRYGWPGNVRELENAMERAAALARGRRVELEDLPEEIRQPPPRIAIGTGPVRPLDEVQKEYILAALALNDGNQTRTAEQLKIGTATLYRKLKSYGMLSTARQSPAH